MSDKTTKCAGCGKKCEIEGNKYKIKYKGKIYCFCSKECKDRFEQAHFGEVLY